MSRNGESASLPWSEGPKDSKITRTKHTVKHFILVFSIISKTDYFLLHSVVLFSIQVYYYCCFETESLKNKQSVDFSLRYNFIISYIVKKKKKGGGIFWIIWKLLLLLIDTLICACVFRAADICFLTCLSLEICNK